MRVLITGAGGLLGGHLAARLASAFTVVAAWRRSPPPDGLMAAQLDLRSAGDLETLVRRHAIEAVVHCAAVADADRCEADPGLAEAVNVELSRSIARLARRARLRLVALSTDLVFDGQSPPYDEAALARPALVYGRTKLAGEEAVLHEAPDAAIARVSLVIGRGHGPRATASESVAWQLLAGQNPRLFSDQIRTPVGSDSVAEGVARLLSSPAAGRFHLAGAEAVSRLELGQRAAEILNLTATGILAVRQADRTDGARRPADVSLAIERARRELGWEPCPLEQAIRAGRRQRP